MAKRRLRNRSNFKKVMAKLPVVAFAAGMRRVDEVAAAGRDMVVRHMEVQDLNWTPLSAARARVKKRLGLDGRTLIATGHAKESVAVVPVDARTRRVGFPDDAMAVDDHGKETNQTLNTVFRAHESGTTNLPKRPLFGPTKKEVERKLREGTI